MKRVIAIFFSVFYLIITIGIGVNVHYCQGEIESIQFVAEQESCCCGGDTDSSCCHDDTQIVKFENEQTIVSDSRISVEQPVIELPQILQIIEEPVTEEKSILFLENDNSPPPYQPAWLLYCSMVFYG